MPEENKSFERTLRDLGRQVEKGAEKVHPITQSELDAVRTAIGRGPSGTSSEEEPEAWSLFTAALHWLRARAVYVATAAVVVLVGGYILLRPGAVVEMAALPSPDRTGATSLPRNARFNPKSRTLDLYEGSTRLSGSMTALPALSAPGVGAFTNNLHGTDSVGAEVWVRGTVWVTNAAGVTSVKRKVDVMGVFIEGTLESPPDRDTPPLPSCWNTIPDSW